MKDVPLPSLFPTPSITSLVGSKLMRKGAWKELEALLHTQTPISSSSGGNRP